VNESGGGRSKIVQEPTLINSEKTAGAATRSVSDIEIAPLAYKLWQGRGCPTGSPDEDRFRAEAELANRGEVAAAA
jgi:hypothetical protein